MFGHDDVQTPSCLNVNNIQYIPLDVIYTYTLCICLWEPSTWQCALSSLCQQCSSTCAGGFQRRVVVCQDENGYPANSCEDRSRPSEQRSCESGPCPQWIYGSWGEVRQTPFNCCFRGLAHREIYKFWDAHLCLNNYFDWCRICSVWRLESTSQISWSSDSHSQSFTQRRYISTIKAALVLSSHSNLFPMPICKTQPLLLLSSVHQAMWRWDKDEAGGMSASKWWAFQWSELRDPWQATRSWAVQYSAVPV